MDTKKTIPIDNYVRCWRRVSPKFSLQISYSFSTKKRNVKCTSFKAFIFLLKTSKVWFSVNCGALFAQSNWTVSLLKLYITCPLQVNQNEMSCWLGSSNHNTVLLKLNYDNKNRDISCACKLKMRRVWDQVRLPPLFRVSRSTTYSGLRFILQNNEISSWYRSIGFFQRLSLHWCMFVLLFWSILFL